MDLTTMAISFTEQLNVSREYQSPAGRALLCPSFNNATSSGAYARLNQGSLKTWLTDRSQEVKTINVGTLGYLVPNAVFFYKGPAYVVIETDGRPVPSEKLLDFAGQLAATLDKGEGEIPPLVEAFAPVGNWTGASLVRCQSARAKGRHPKSTRA